MPTSASTSIPTPVVTSRFACTTCARSTPSGGGQTGLEQLGEQIAELSGQIAARGSPHAQVA